MTRSFLHPGRAILTAVFPAMIGLLMSSPGVLLAREPGPDLPADPVFLAGEPPLLLPAEANRGLRKEAADSPGIENIPPERLERWRAMPPEERERIRERYRRWKELPPERRKRIIERNRRLRQLPEEQRNYLKDRRELLKDAGPEELRVVRKFFARMRSLPPPARRIARRKIWEWRSLPPGEREEAMLSWPFYRGLSDRERETFRWFLFARPGDQRIDGDRAPRE